jgi:hypothetical protein
LNSCHWNVFRNILNLFQIHLNILRFHIGYLFNLDFFFLLNLTGRMIVSDRHCQSNIGHHHLSQVSSLIWRRNVMGMSMIAMLFMWLQVRFINIRHIQNVYWTERVKWQTIIFASNNEPNSWLCSDFKNSLVHPNSYSVQSSEKHWGTRYQLVSWVIETSNDYNQWTEIDRHENDHSLLSATRSFSVPKPCKFSRYIWLRQIGKASGGKPDYLVVTSFELFVHIKKSKWWAMIWICTKVLRVPKPVIIHSEFKLEVLWE